MNFSIFRVVHPTHNFRTLVPLQKEPHPRTITPISLSPSPWQPQIDLLSVWICAFWTHRPVIFCDWLLSCCMMLFVTVSFSKAQGLCNAVPCASSALLSSLQPRKLPLTSQSQIQISLLLDPTYVTPVTMCCNHMESSRDTDDADLPEFKSDLCDHGRII